MHRSLRILMVTLGVLGFLLQTLAGGSGVGRALCVGCERGWWTISLPCAPEQATNCCGGDESECDDAAPNSGDPVVRDSSDCGCVDVPLPEPTLIGLAAARINPDTLGVSAAPVAILWPLVTAERPAPWAPWARAGPPCSPRLLTPLSRCTVLVL